MPLKPEDLWSKEDIALLKERGLDVYTLTSEELELFYTNPSFRYKEKIELNKLNEDHNQNTK